MSNDEFIKLIESIGFKNYTGSNFYGYKGFRIELFKDNYNLWNGSNWVDYIPYTDLTPIENKFKNELRSIKLKELLR